MQRRTTGLWRGGHQFHTPEELPNYARPLGGIPLEDGSICNPGDPCWDGFMEAANRGPFNSGSSRIRAQIAQMLGGY